MMIVDLRKATPCINKNENAESHLRNRVMYIKLPTSQWFILECFHRISGCSNIIIGDHNKTTMLASCIESADISILLHIDDVKLNVNI